MWSNYQEAIFEQVRNTRNNLVVVARAGSGKTTTIVQSLSEVPETSQVLLCAFNKAIQKELEKKAPKHVKVQTLHGLGYGTLLRNNIKFDVEENKAYTLVRAITEDRFNDLTGSDARNAIKRLMGLAKNMVVGCTDDVSKDTADLIEIAEDFDLDDPIEYPASRLAAAAVDVLRVCADLKSPVLNGVAGNKIADLMSAAGKVLIDYDDMIWLPALKKMKVKSYDVVFVDEAQDLSAAQEYLVENAIGRNGRIVAVGDDRQAIYGWRGAGSGVLDKIKARFNAVALPLSITYRCPKSVVKLANDAVPDLEVAPNAKEGLVKTCTFEEMDAGVAIGDFVLSRTNAPLTAICLRLLARRIPARIQGKDIGRSLAALARKSKKTDVPDMILWLQRQLESEKERAEKSGDERKLEALQDKVNCLVTLSEGCHKVQQVVDRIEMIFSDDDDDRVVLLSTVHRAKGLERDRVWMLDYTFKNINRSREEQNIWYVAVTRAKSELHRVTTQF